MKKVSKAILIGLAVVVALVVALLVGLNLYVQSPGAQARIQEELSKALRLPLKITNTSVTPWSDLRITGISIPSGETNFLEATSFTARYRLLPLLGGKLVIPEMRVENPKVIWAQNAQGKWELPSPEVAEQVSKEASPEPAPAAAPSATETPAGTEKAPKVAKTEKGKMEKQEKKALEVVIDRFDVKDGSFELLDKDRKPVAVFTGVNMTYTKLTAEHLEGTATVAHAVWAEGWTLENAKSSFSYVSANHELWLPEVTATIAGGNLKGNYRSHAETKHNPFSYKLEFDHVNLDQLVVQNKGEAGQATGTLRGTLEMHGDTDRMEKAEGSGQLELRDGALRQFELFSVIGRILGIRELEDFRIRKGVADFRVAGEKLLVEQVNLDAPSLLITAKGTVRLDKNEKDERKLSLDAQLAVDDAVVAKLPGNAPDAFVSDGQGRRTIDFNITGTTDKPKTNLGDKLLAQTLGAQVSGLFGTIFDGKKTEDLQRKKEEEKKKKEEDDRKKAEKEAKKDKKKKDKDKTPAPADAPATTAAASTPAPAPAPSPASASTPAPSPAAAPAPAPAPAPKL